MLRAKVWPAPKLDKQFGNYNLKMSWDVHAIVTFLWTKNVLLRVVVLCAGSGFMSRLCFTGQVHSCDSYARLPRPLPPRYAYVNEEGKLNNLPPLPTVREQLNKHNIWLYLIRLTTTNINNNVKHVTFYWNNMSTSWYLHKQTVLHKFVV